ncbi:MAG TPA: hypothetical protein VJ901_06260 [Thermoanaerobaculia bacterium]|nr:hypothetical protein [Thermoanaerobaculia bacterium]
MLGAVFIVAALISGTGKYVVEIAPPDSGCNGRNTDPRDPPRRA